MPDERRRQVLQQQRDIHRLELQGQQIEALRSALEAVSQRHAEIARGFLNVARAFEEEPAPTLPPRAARQFIDERDAAKYVGMSTAYLRVARRHGRGPAFIRIGRTIRYDIHDLDDWLGTYRVRARESSPKPPRK